MINKVFLQINDCYVHAVERGEMIFKSNPNGGARKLLALDNLFGVTTVTALDVATEPNKPTTGYLLEIETETENAVVLTLQSPDVFLKNKVVV